MGMVLLLRADANVQIGTGHVMRCLALAQAWQDGGGQAVFVAIDMLPALGERLRVEGFDVVALKASDRGSDASRTAAIGREIGASWIVADGYHFDADYQKTLKDCGVNLLLLDDYGHAEHYYADLVLNQNICADAETYRSREPYTRLLLGTRYALLRREFWSWRGWQRLITPLARRILVTLGGVDVDNMTCRVLEALRGIPDAGAEAVVVMGGGNPHYAEAETTARASTIAIEIRRDVHDMPSLMAWADVAVAAAGSTVWELAFMGLPSAIVALAENQERAAAMLVEQGVCLGLGDAKTVTPQAICAALRGLMKDIGTRQAMAQRGSKLVSGDGPHEVVRCLAQPRMGGAG